MTPKQTKPRVQWSRKLGHLYQVFFGLPGNGAFGYSPTRRLATQQARERYHNARLTS